LEAYQQTNNCHATTDRSTFLEMLDFITSTLKRYFEAIMKLHDPFNPRTVMPSRMSCIGPAACFSTHSLSASWAAKETPKEYRSFRRLALAAWWALLQEYVPQ
jgi:hypothetical protein